MAQYLKRAGILKYIVCDTNCNDNFECFNYVYFYANLSLLEKEHNTLRESTRQLLTAASCNLDNRSL